MAWQGLHRVAFSWRRATEAGASSLGSIRTHPTRTRTHARMHRRTHNVGASSKSAGVFFCRITSLLCHSVCVCVLEQTFTALSRPACFSRSSEACSVEQERHLVANTRPSSLTELHDHALENLDQKKTLFCSKLKQRILCGLQYRVYIVKHPR